MPGHNHPAGAAAAKLKAENEKVLEENRQLKLAIAASTAPPQSQKRCKVAAKDDPQFVTCVRD